MRILHSSDLHGNWEVLYLHKEFDLWIDSGDFFPNLTRGEQKVEAIFQQEILEVKRESQRILDWLKERPLISISGNHDYVSLASILKTHEGNAYDLSESPVSLFGETFAGFREIPYIIGEWAGETEDFSEIVGSALNADPTILVTHAPPCNILDEQSHGISELTTALAYREHNINHHFFGHIHSQGGKDITQMGVMFHNSATLARVVEI